ncbi:tannase/feruloyl esterase family alpha/beta hydrolase [uncultured Paludibaculum sp.]|uniref:tannase/feruloyl esterase family alpha/beta hydrolase n=1 Tax=uncultured Paludibaculum sp. TaxID=1765020 RepID=UPI00374DE9F3
MLAKAYYGEGPRKSYYEGCSQGGRQGLTLDQCSPSDLDGIIPGASALFQTGTHPTRAHWTKGINANPFPASKLGLRAKSVHQTSILEWRASTVHCLPEPRQCDHTDS